MLRQSIGQFGVYEIMKPVFASLLASDGGGSNTGVAYLLASIVAGAVAALLLCPMESTRIKMVTDPAYGRDNLLTALGRIAATEGLAASFGGLWAMLSKQVPYTFGKQVSFDVVAGLLYVFFGRLQKQWTGLSDGSVKWAVSVFAAMAASLVACILSQPGDMILTETYKPQKMVSVDVMFPGNDDDASAASTDISTASSSVSSDTSRVDADAIPSDIVTTGKSDTALLGTPPSSTISTAFSDVVARLYREDGIAKFFTGTQARIVHVGLIITSQLVVYDIVKQILGLPATGSH